MDKTLRRRKDTLASVFLLGGAGWAIAPYSLFGIDATARNQTPVEASAPVTSYCPHASPRTVA